MKIERVNERQIRCTLTGSDLQSRQLKISELAYGSEKAKLLFRDMMRQAEYECGFEANDNIPLVIEAIPVNSDCIILIITKVEDPEELDTRFSKFAPSVSVSDENTDASLSPNDFAQEMINMLRQVKNSLPKLSENAGKTSDSKSDKADDPGQQYSPSCLLSDADLDGLATFSRSISSYYNEKSSLFRDNSGDYHLLLEPGEMDNISFARICNIASEFGTITPAPKSRISYVQEHFRLIIADNAVKSLSQI